MKEFDKEALFQILVSEHTFNTFIQHILSSTSGPMTSVLSQPGRSAKTDRYLTELSKKAIQPSVRAKAYRSQHEGKMKWFEGREWKWIDKSYGIGRFCTDYLSEDANGKAAIQRNAACCLGR